MKLMISRIRRSAALVLALALLASAELGLFVPALAAETKSTDLYALIADEYFSKDADAAGILVSGALNGNAAVKVVYPGSADGLVSIASGRIYAKSFASGYKNLKWMPESYTCGAASGNFVNNEAAFDGAEGAVAATVKYQLVLTNADSDLLKLPATLMSEAKDQKYILDKFVSEDEPYMNYMKQMDRDKIDALIVALMPDDIFEIGPLNGDPAKDAAIRESFTKTFTGIRNNCYNDDKEIKLYRLFLSYVDGGLKYYYVNNAEFQVELDLFTMYMEDLLGAENWNGVELTEEDKVTAADILKRKAASMLGVGAEIEFLALRDKMRDVRARLTPPNEAINVNSSKLANLVQILEKDGSVTSYSEQPTLRTSFVVELCNHSYDSDADMQCNHCEYKRSDESAGGDSNSSDSGSDNSGSGSIAGGEESGSNSGNASSDVDFENMEFGSGDSTSVGTAAELEKYLSAAETGATICLVKNIELTENLQVDCSVTIENAYRLQSNGYALELTSSSAGIEADGEVKVVSAVDGYRPVQNGDSYTYALTEVNAPDINSVQVAGDKVEKLSTTRYLFLDIDPNGVCLNDLKKAVDFADLDGYAIELSIEGNDGTHLVKTADRLVATATDSGGVVVAKVTYVVIVLGDTNCNGKVNTSDATVTRNISAGGASTLEVRMAANVNFSGTLEDPKINSSDISYVMAKWFAWDLNKYVSNIG